MPKKSSGTPYVLAWIALVILTAASFGASRLSLGAFATPVALAIAVAKSSLVLMIFMHLYREPFVLRFIAAINLGWVIMLCAGIAADVAAR